MMRSAPTMITLAIFAFVLILLPGASLAEQRTLLEFDFNGQRISIPYFDENVKLVPSERRSFELAALGEFQRLTKKTVQAAFYERKSYFQLVPYMYQIIKAFNEDRKQFKKIPTDRRGPKIGGKFTHDIYRMWMETIKTAQRQVKQEKKLKIKPWPANEQDVLNFIQRLDDFSALMYEVVHRSPAGLYMSWRDMTIDNRPVAEVASDFIIFAKRNGFRGPVAITSYLASFLSLFDWESDRTPSTPSIPASS